MSAQQAMLPVGIGEFLASNDPLAILIAYGLGSCVGVCIYDCATKVGGLAHVMLPSSSEAVAQRPPGKFADRAVPLLVEKLVGLGAGRSRLVSKIAGGAQMLTAPGFANSFNIGERNVAAVRAALEGCRVPLVSADTGGNRGRTVTLHLRSSRVLVRTAGEKETDL